MHKMPSVKIDAAIANKVIADVARKLVMDVKDSCKQESVFVQSKVIGEYPSIKIIVTYGSIGEDKRDVVYKFNPNTMTLKFEDETLKSGCPAKDIIDIEWLSGRMRNLVKESIANNIEALFDII